jgi:ABC-2 type transport system ATP-binding protein
MLVQIRMAYIIETNSLTKHFDKGQVKAVNNLNLKVRKGEIYAFIGANGTGKSTALNMIAGILKPTSGEIKVLGLEMPKYRHTLSKYIGVAPQEYSIYLDLTVKENIMFFARINQIPKSEAKSRMNELIKIFDLIEKENVVCSKLSGGMKRRVSIICCLIHNPKLVIFDEATVGVDPVLREWFWKYFRSLSKEGTTIVVTSHVMDEAEKADRIGLIRGGSLIDEGTPEELKQKYQCSTIEEVFLKTSREVVV